MFYTYILYSESFDRFYVGQTQNIKQRIKLHNAGKVDSTRAYRPWNLKLVVEKASRSEAMKLETKLKNLSKLRKIAFIKKYS